MRPVVQAARHTARKPTLEGTNATAKRGDDKDNDKKAEAGVGGRPHPCGLCRIPFKPKETQALVAFACGHVFHLKCLLRHGQGETADDSGIKKADSQDRFAVQHYEEEEGEEDDFEGLLMGRRKATALRLSADEDEDREDDFGYYSKRASVAEKVTRAVLIKDKIKGGCPLEKKEDEW